MYAVMSDSDDTDARVRIWRVDFVWMMDRVCDAFAAEGSSARDGRVMVLRL